MPYSFEVSDVLPAPPRDIYEAWLSSDGHSAMTGAPAHVEAVVGGEFDAWDGYIVSRTLELEPFGRIVQSWRTGEFADGDADSTIEVLLEPVPDGTRITIRHSGVPDGQTGYELGGWQESYFDPMKEYFSAR